MGKRIAVVALILSLLLASSSLVTAGALSDTKAGRAEQARQAIQAALERKMSRLGERVLNAAEPKLDELRANRETIVALQAEIVELRKQIAAEVKRLREREPAPTEEQLAQIKELAKVAKGHHLALGKSIGQIAKQVREAQREHGATRIAKLKVAGARAIEVQEARIEALEGLKAAMTAALAALKAL
jgi:hypothetical protein